MRSGFWLPFSDRDLAIIRTSSEIVALEVVSSTLHVGTVRGKPRTCSLQSLLSRPLDRFLKVTQGNLAPSSLPCTGFDVSRGPWVGLWTMILLLSLFWQLLPPSKPYINK